MDPSLASNLTHPELYAARDLLMQRDRQIRHRRGRNRIAWACDYLRKNGDTYDRVCVKEAEPALEAAQHLADVKLCAAIYGMMGAGVVAVILWGIPLVCLAIQTLGRALQAAL